MPIICPTPASDLQAISVSVSPISITAGENKIVTYEIKNIGDLASTPSQLAFYLSKDNTFSTDDVLMTTNLLSFGVVNVNETQITLTTFTIRSNTSGGIYYIILVINNSEDSNINNNVVSSSSSFRVTAIPDSDGDGIPDNIDSCPNENGPASNNGCPVFPNLVVDLVNSIVSSTCHSCIPFLNSFMMSGKRHLVSGGVGSINFNPLRIKNTGNTISTSARIDFYYSGNNTLNKTSDLLFKSINIPSLNIGSSHNIPTMAITGFDIFGSDAYSPVTNGNFFIIIDVDALNSNIEGFSGEQDNILVIPMSFNSSTTATSKNTNTKERLEKNQVNIVGLIDIYNFQGQKVLSKEVISKEEENKLIQSLGSGLYIVKSENKNYKISIK